jgi:curved DNA-binding protein CbpA
MAAKKLTYYQLLGLTPGVSHLEIKRAYRQLVKSHHPDVDYYELTPSQRKLANEKMSKLNEAYEILKDKVKRCAYDTTIAQPSSTSTRVPVMDPADNEESCERYLRQIFHPSRHAIVNLLKKYKQQLSILSQDIYDDALVGDFEKYCDALEAALITGSRALSSKRTPRSLEGAELMMRYAIAQAVDGLEELRRFCRNYDYDHLSMAGNLFREANNLAKKSLQLTKP